MTALIKIQRDKMVTEMELLRMQCRDENEFYSVLAEKMSRMVDDIHDFYLEKYDCINSKDSKKKFQ